MTRVYLLIATGLILVCSNLYGVEIARTPSLLFEEMPAESGPTPRQAVNESADLLPSNAELQQQIDDLRKIIEEQNAKADEAPVDDGWEDTSNQSWTKIVGGRFFRGFPANRRSRGKTVPLAA